MTAREREQCAAGPTCARVCPGWLAWLIWQLRSICGDKRREEDAVCGCCLVEQKIKMVLGWWLLCHDGGSLSDATTSFLFPPRELMQQPKYLFSWYWNPGLCRQFQSHSHGIPSHTQRQPATIWCTKNLVTELPGTRGHLRIRPTPDTLYTNHFARNLI